MPDRSYNTYTPARYGYNNASANRPGQNRRRQHGCLVGAILWLLTPAIWALDHPIAMCRLGYRYLCKLLLRAKRPKRKTTDSSRKEKTKSTSTDPATREYHVDRPTGTPPPDEISPVPASLTTTATAMTTTMVTSKDQAHADKAPDSSTDPSSGPARPEIPPEPPLHYIDLTSDTAESKKLRLNRFGSEDPVPDDGLADLASTTCQPRTTAPCDICAIQTCAVSSPLPWLSPVPLPQTSPQHLTPATDLHHNPPHSPTRPLLPSHLLPTPLPALFLRLALPSPPARARHPRFHHPHPHLRRPRTALRPVAMAFLAAKPPHRRGIHAVDDNGRHGAGL